MGNGRMGGWEDGDSPVGGDGGKHTEEVNLISTYGLVLPSTRCPPTLASLQASIVLLLTIQ